MGGKNYRETTCIVYSNKSKCWCCCKKCDEDHVSQ